MVARLLALAVLAASAVYLASGLRLPLGTTARPGPGFFPLAVGIFGVGVALAWAVSAFRQAPAGAFAGLTLPEGRRVGATAGLLVGFCLLLPWTGYLVAALFFTGLLLRGLGTGWVTALAVAGGSAVASYFLFATILGVPLPRGVLFD